MELWTLYPVADSVLLKYDAIIRSQQYGAILLCSNTLDTLALEEDPTLPQNTGIQLPNNAVS